MKTLPYILVIIILAISADLKSQLNFNFQEINQKDGLPEGLIFDLEEDNQGFIWLAMTTGLFKYDGSQFERIQYKTNNGKIGNYFFRNILKDKKGNLWAGTISNGLFYINTSTETAQHFIYNANDSLSIADNQIGGIFQDSENRIWISTRKEGFCLYEPQSQTFKRFKPDQHLDIKQENINKIFDFAYQKPYLWLATGNGLVRFHTEQNDWKYFAPCNQNNTINPNLLNGFEEGLRKIFIDNDTLWLGTRVGGLIAFDLKTNYCFLIKNPKGKETKLNQFSYIKPYRDDLVWVFNDNDLRLFDKSNFQFSTLHPSLKNSNFDFDNVYKILTSKEGTLWISDRNSLLKTKKIDNQFQNISFPTNVHNGFIYPQQPLIFAASRKETAIYIYNTLSKQTKTIRYQPHSPRTNNYIANFLYNPINQQLYLEESADIYIWNKARQSIDLFFSIKDYFTQHGFENFDGITASTIDKQGNIWIGTKFEGILKINPFTKEIKHFIKENKNKRQSLVHNSWIADLKCDSKGRVWYVSEKGFGYYHPEKKGFVNYPVGSYHTSNPSVILNDLNAVGEDSLGRIWIGSQNGGLGYFNPNDKNVIIQTYENEGLRSNKVIKFFNDNQSDMWLMHNKGLSKINTSTLEVANFGEEYDLEGAYRIFQSTNGTVLKSQQNQLIQFQPENIQPSTSHLKLYFKNFQVFDESLQLAQALSEIEKIRLNYSQNFFAITYGAIHFDMPNLITYAYKLDGVDAEWNHVGQRKRASYTNIKGGHYTFRLKAKIENGSWSPEIKLRIYIQPPFWQTWWFYAIVGLSLLAIIYVWYQYRIQQIKEKEALKTAFNKQIAEVEMTALRAQMNPHFLFNCLNSIKLFIMENDTDAASTYLTKFSKLIRLILNNSKTHFVLLSNELNALQLYMDLEAMRLNHQFKYQIDIESSIDTNQLEVPPLILQPYIENAIWHGLVDKHNNNLLGINIQIKNNHLVFTIHDNGIGRKASQAKKAQRHSKRKSHGMTITQNRIELTKELYQVDASVTIEDLYDTNNQAAGTKVIISIPILKVKSMK